MIQQHTATDCIIMARNSICAGADALGLQTCYLQPEYRTLEQYQNIYAAMGRRPVYVTSYRSRFNETLNDQECMDNLLVALQAGGTLGDVMGDVYDRTPGELTLNSDAIEKQKALIDQIHSMGKEVLMSSHIMEFRPADRIIEIALAHESRGADISKIVSGAANEDEEMENIRITHLLKKELKIPYLFLSAGHHTYRHRILGTAFGNCMCLTVDHHHMYSVKQQPTVAAARSVIDNVEYL